VKTLTLCAVLALGACHFGEPAASPTPPGGIPSNLVLRSYVVPGGAAQQVRSVLKDVLWIGSDGKGADKFLGRADVGPDGRLVVMASEGVQEGVKAFIDSLDQKPPKPPATIDTDVWLVDGVPGKSVPPATGLQEVAPALAQIEKSDGPMEFKLVEKVRLTQLSSEEAKVNGRQLSVDQTTWMKPDGLKSDLAIHDIRGQRLETRVNLKLDQVMVLGSAGAGKDDAPRSVYVLIRAGLHDGAGQ
jgi:hypothetical protein